MRRRDEVAREVGVPSVPGPHPLPSRKTVRLEPRRATRREATCTPMNAHALVVPLPRGRAAFCPAPPGFRASPPAASRFEALGPGKAPAGEVHQGDDGWEGAMDDFDSYPRPVSDPAVDGLPETADDDS